MPISRPLALSLLLLAAAATALADTGLQAISKPSADVTLNFVRPGRVLEYPAKEGATVKAGEVLVRLDDAEEQAALAQDKAKADDLTKIDAQKAIKAQKEQECAKIKVGYEKGASSIYEYEEAKLNVVVEDARLKLTDFEHEMDKLKAQQTAVAVARMQLKSPIDGIVETAHVKVGESVEPQTKVIRVININPLWVEVPVPYSQALTLKKDQTGVITYSDKTTGQGKIIHIASLADPGSATLLVRLEAPNPTLKPAGDRVTVEFPAGKVAGQ